MATSKWISLVVVLLCQSAVRSQVLSVLRDVRYCFKTDLEPCLVNHAVKVLLDVTDLSDAVNQTEEGRSSSASVETGLANKLAEEVADFTPGLLAQAQRGRADPVLRTFHRAWKYMIPLLIGVMLKLATFVPMVLAVLTIIANGAFLSGNLALLLTGLNIALKYWNPKTEHHAYHDFSHNHDFQSHDQQHSLFQGHNQQPSFGGYQPQQHQQQQQPSLFGQLDAAFKPHRRISPMTY